MIRKAKVIERASTPLIIKPDSSLTIDSSSSKSNILSLKSSSAEFKLKTKKNKYQLNIEDFEPLKKDTVSGGFGTVIFVRNKKSGKQYAAKTSNQILNPDDNKYLLRELNILMKIQHPTIVHLEGFSLQDMRGNDSITIFTDFIERGTLADIIENVQNGNLPKGFNNTKRQIILVGIARGMMILHKNNVINRDLKPQNVLIDKDFKPLLTDFGLSKFFNPQDSQNQSIGDMGTHAYKAPEIVDGNSFNTKADVYAFGILMYELVTGSNAINSIMSNKKFNPYIFYSQILSGKRPTFNPGQKIKPGFRRMIEKCWSADPNERPTFSELYSKLTLNVDDYYTDSNNNICESIIKCDDDDNDKSLMSTNYCYDDVDFDELFQYINEISETASNSNDEEIELLKQKVKQINKCSMKMQEEIDELKTENLKMKNENQKLKNKVAQITSENTQIKDDIEELKKIIFQLQNKSDKTKDIDGSSSDECMKVSRTNKKIPKKAKIEEEIDEENKPDKLLDIDGSSSDECMKVSRTNKKILTKAKIKIPVKKKNKKEETDIKTNEHRETDKYDTKAKEFAQKEDRSSIKYHSSILNKNVLSYANGARVTYISARPYNTNPSFYDSINGGYTGKNSPVFSKLEYSEDNFWGAKNSWNAQGALENDDNKYNIGLTHNGAVKKKTSSTTAFATGGSSATITVIINPRAYHGDISIFKMSECYLASADSDGDVGGYKIFVSTKNDISVATNPNDPSWIYVTEGTLTTDAVLTKVYSGNINFMFIKLVLNNRGKSYLELAAIKVY